jgi:RNA polymerase sigma factor for flagellar operon FliA
MKDADTDFVTQHRALVESIARSVQTQLRYAADTEDLVGYGLIGLLEARSRYDASRGFQFSTFAYYRVRGAMFDGIGKMARVPRSVVRESRALSVLDTESEHVADTRAGGAVVVNPKQAAIDALSIVLSRAATAYTLAVMAPERVSPETEVANKEALDAIRKATETLPERERAVIQGHYMEDRQLDDIAKDFGISKSWMSRLHAKALDRLRAALTGDGTLTDERRTD